MPKKDVTLSCVFALVLAAASSIPALADAVVKVSLWDKGGMMDMNMHGNTQMAIMGIDIDQKKVPAGKVTFDVSNASKETLHEMLISPIKDENIVLPIVANEDRVDEKASGDLGEVSELDPGKSGALTLELKPGLYILFCNIPGHFMAGMWTTI